MDRYWSSMFRTPGFLLLSFLLLPLLLHRTIATKLYYPTANLSSKWQNTLDPRHTIKYKSLDGETYFQPLLLRQTSAIIGPSFACGFYCTNPRISYSCDSFLFAIIIIYINSSREIDTKELPPVVWSANRNSPIREEGATLELTRDGGLILKDLDGSPVWSTSTSEQSVVGMNLTENGNLMLVGENGKVIWQSFDHPTDTMVPGQKLMEGQRITTNTSTTNSTEGQYYLSATLDGWRAFIDSTPPQLYKYATTRSISNGKYPTFVQFTNGRIEFYNSSNYFTLSSWPLITTAQYMRLEFDGHLKVYGWDDTDKKWYLVVDVIDATTPDSIPSVCTYPTVCGNYGVCNGGHCSCPRNSSGSVNYFELLNTVKPNDGCAQIKPLSCQASQDHQFLILSNVSYFTYIDYKIEPNPNDYYLKSNWTTEESCKNACLRNCSCKAAFFQYGSNASAGRCFLPSQVFSMMTIKPDSIYYNSTAYIKVQDSSAVDAPPEDSSAVGAPPGVSLNPESKSVPIGTIVGSVLGALLGLSLIIGVLVIFRKRRNISDEEEEDNEDHIDQLPGMTTRFSYEELKVATNNFFEKLGEGGFGSVFEGTLTDGTRIAVKRLDNVGQGKREFLSEVETIGSIHHVHLVRLVGFCTWKSHKLLVYEYMSNGSLDKWIFKNGKSETQLDWKTKCKIINHVAKGLLYLHEECRQRIAHLDIKPQNILLDHNFDAKVSDFGLSKLIDRDQSAVMTRMRGTPGYLAPEWLTSVITEKVDIYSFGVVIIEVVCGRKNLDHSLPEESNHLHRILIEKAEHGSISDFVEEYSRQSVNVDLNEVEKMLRLAMWCLQRDTDRRPSMSSVVKVLEGSLDVDSCLNYNMWTIGISGSSNQSAPLLSSILSGPR